jgi:hypothetical protein
MVTAVALVQYITLPLSAADRVRDAAGSVMIPSELRIKAGAEPGRKATVLSMIAPMLVNVGLRPF